MNETDETNQPSGVHAKLLAFKAEHDVKKTDVLPATGISVTYDGFIGHDAVLAATKIAGKKRERVGLILVARHVTFESEKLSTEEIGSLFPNEDVVHLIGLVLSQDEDGEVEEASGN